MIFKYVIYSLYLCKTTVMVSSLMSYRIYMYMCKGCKTGPMAFCSYPPYPSINTITIVSQYIFEIE